MSGCYLAGVFDTSGRVQIVPGWPVLWVAIRATRRQSPDLVELGAKWVGPSWAILTGSDAHDFLEYIKDDVVRKAHTVYNALRVWEIQRQAAWTHYYAVHASVQGVRVRC